VRNADYKLLSKGLLQNDILYNICVSRQSLWGNLRGVIMARVISDKCIGCGACETTCPVEAIFMGESHFEIAPDICIDCGVCEIGCHADAISSI
jgi:ferredoxin